MFEHKLSHHEQSFVKITTTAVLDKDETIPLNNDRLSDKFDLNTPRVDVP